MGDLCCVTRLRRLNVLRHVTRLGTLGDFEPLTRLYFMGDFTGLTKSMPPLAASLGRG